MAKPPASNTPPMQESPSLAGRRRACAISDRRRRFEGHGQKTTQPWWLILDLRQLVKSSSDPAQLPGPSKKKSMSWENENHLQDSRGTKEAVIMAQRWVPSNLAAESMIQAYSSLLQILGQRDTPRPYWLPRCAARVVQLSMTR